MRPMPLDEQMLRIKRLAQDREDKLGYQADVDFADSAGGEEEEAGAAVDGHSDAWAFSWMPAIEDFVEQAAARAGAAREDSGSDASSSDEKGPSRKEEPRGGAVAACGGRVNRLGNSDGDTSSSDESDSARSGRKRRRTRTREGAWSRRAPRPPSYNETLLADKSFHNPHASETMADALDVFRPASFLLDVGADDRPWGGAAAATAATSSAAAAARAGNDEGAAPVESRKGSDTENARGGDGSGSGDRSWFYDTVRDRQNRLWADTRVRKGVELARKGQHQAAIDIYTQALGMCPDHGDGLVARGAAFATTGRLRNAIQDLSRAVSLDPHNDNASNYLKETRRRMERQESRELPSAATAGVGLVGRGGSRLERAEHSEWMEADAVSTRGAAILRGSEGNEASRSALRTLLQDGAEGDALRKMRALLEEDERKRKRERKSSGAGGRGEGRGDADEGGGGGGKKKSRKKEKKSKSKRRSASRHKRDRERGKDQRQSAGGGGDSRFDSGSSSSSSSSSSGTEDVGSRSKKKKKKRRKHRKRSRARSMSPSASAAGSRNWGGLRGTLAASSAAYSAVAEGSEADDPHPILQRKKHSLWG